MKNSTQKIKPVGYNVDLKYRCPYCGSDLWATQQEAKVDGFRFVCCGQVLVIEPVAKFTLNVEFKSGLTQYDTSTKESRAKIQKRVTTDLIRATEALNKLHALGFSKTKHQAEAITYANQGDDVESIIRKCIANAD